MRKQQESYSESDITNTCISDVWKTQALMPADKVHLLHIIKTTLLVYFNFTYDIDYIYYLN